MNRFNNKKYYKPPPVKPSNKLREKSKEEWNPYKSDLNKYKLSYLGRPVIIIFL